MPNRRHPTMVKPPVKHRACRLDVFQVIKDQLEVLHPRPPEKRRTRRIHVKPGNLRIAMRWLDHNKTMLGIKIGQRPVPVL